MTMIFRMIQVYNSTTTTTKKPIGFVVISLAKDILLLLLLFLALASKVLWFFSLKKFLWMFAKLVNLRNFNDSIRFDSI